MKLLAFAASHRPDSYNRKLLQCAISHLKAQSIIIDFVEYGEFDMPIYNDTIPETSGIPDYAYRLASRAKDADGIMIASPEYNWSYPGSLKNIIDWTSCIDSNPLSGKTALLMSATPGSRGGIIGLQHLKTPLEALEILVFHKVFPLGKCLEAFDKNGNLSDPKQSEHLHTILDRYVTFTRNHSNKQ